MALYSETGRLRRVVVHTPGREVEKMTPTTARELLYNDIVPLESVKREHARLRAVLSLVAETYEMTDVLEEIAAAPDGPALLATAVSHGVTETRDRLLRRWHGAAAEMIARECVVGVPLERSRLSDFYADSPFTIPPLPNAYFTRDAAFTVYDRAYQATMAEAPRRGEAALMGAVLSRLGVAVENRFRTEPAPIEGGDVLVLDGDTLLIGIGERTTPKGVDTLIETIVADRDRPLRVIVVELPRERATIHLDMIATLIGPETILGFKPLLTGRSACRTFTIHADPGYGAPWRIDGHDDLIAALNAIGRPHRIVPCGGNDETDREREQWFSACNSVAVGPQQIIVYENNIATLTALQRAGYQVHSGDDVLADPSRILAAGDGSLMDTPIAIAVAGVELARGGGGPRCMTLPIERDKETMYEKDK